MSDQQLISTSRINYKAVAITAFVILGLLNLWIVAVNHYCFRTFAFDYGVYNFAFFDFAHAHVSPCTVYLFPYPVTFLQDHFSLALFFLSPLYWLLAWLTGSYTLLVIQWAIVMLGGWATYRLIAVKSGSLLMGLLVLLYYFFLYGRYAAYAGDCNLAIIGSAMLPVLLYVFETRKLMATLLCFLFVVFTREDYPILLLFLFVFLMTIHRKDQYKFRLALGLLLASAVAMALTFKVFIPALEDANKKYTFFEFHVVGKTAGEALLFMMQHPIKAIELLFVNHSGDPAYDGVKLDFYCVYLVSGGILLFLRPLYLLPFLPLLAKKMYADEPFRWSIESYYSVEFVSLMPVMVFSVLLSFKNERLTNRIAACICLITLGVTAQKLLYHGQKVVSDNSKYNFMKASFYTSDYDHHKVQKVINSLPATARVSASGRLLPHVALRKKIYYFPRIEDANYIVLLKHDDNYPLNAENFQKEIYLVRRDPEWRMIQDNPDYVIFFKAGL